MSTKNTRIALVPAADPTRVHDVIRAAAEARGYAPAVADDGAVILYEAGNTGAGSSSMSLLVEMTVTDDAVELRRASSGHVGIALGLGPLGETSVTKEFATVSDWVCAALADAGLAD